MAYLNPNDLTNPLLASAKFGVPGCLIDLTAEMARLLPGDILGNYATGLKQGRESAQNHIASITKKVFRDTGIISFNTATGTIEFFSKANASNSPGALGGITAFAGNVAGFGQALWENVEAGIAAVNQISDCVDEVKDWLSQSTANQTAGSSPSFASQTEQQNAATAIQQSNDYIASVNAALQIIENELLEREKDPLREPILITDGISADPDEEPEPIFRLVYGPPKSKSGQFLLSIDGIYYNSQTSSYAMGDVPTQADIGFVPAPDRWTLDHPANLGGKGKGFSMKQVNQYVGTIFDINKIDNTETLQTHYKADTLYNQLIGQKNVAVDNLKKQKADLIASGYAADSAIVYNMDQNIMSVISEYDFKINKRKKQIEVAVKAPDFFGLEQPFFPGHIPVNDFSFLSSLNLSVEVAAQRDLTFDHGEVKDIILPIKPIFVKAKDSEYRVQISELEVADVGTGALTDYGDVSSVEETILFITDEIQTSGLVASYSFLLPNVETSGSSMIFNSLNDHGDAGYLNAQILGSSASSVFLSGVSIPKLKGICQFGSPVSGTAKGAPETLGSVVRLPDGPELQNLMYNNTGCSFDFWIHMPKFGQANNPYEKDNGATPVINAESSEWVDFNYYKIILGNENIGGTYKADATQVTNVNGTQVVKGMLMGFSRDPQIVRDTTAVRGSTFDIGDSFGVDTSSTVSSMAFFIAPTQSVNGNDVEFIRKGSCNNLEGEYCKFKVSTSATTESGYGLSSLSSGFYHMSVTMDVQEDDLSLYLNGELLESSSYSEVFGIETKTPAKLPTFIAQQESSNPSFYYKEANLLGSASPIKDAVFHSGPQTNTYFTPWIIGGGWTDGIPEVGFMGTGHGLSSGLGGHVGSFKVYSRPLNTTEIISNYNAHKNYYKDIDV